MKPSMRTSRFTCSYLYNVNSFNALKIAKSSRCYLQKLLVLIDTFVHKFSGHLLVSILLRCGIGIDVYLKFCKTAEPIISIILKRSIRVF